MPLRHKIASFGLALVALVLAVSVSIAQVAPDVPTITGVSGGHGKIRVTIVAGASGAPNGFSVCYMPAALFALHNNQWPANGWWQGEGWNDYTGIGTLNTWGSEAVDFKLAPGQSMDVEIGDAEDESGVYGTPAGELLDNTAYVLCVFAMPAPGGLRSAYSANIAKSTTTQGEDCTFTVGYWKNHPGAWPVSTLTLGTVSYTAAELLTILGTPVGGNGLISLAHQLIATKLNILNGANPATIAATVSAADALIGGLVVPTIGSGFLSPASTSALTQSLDDYNNGLTGPGHCISTPAQTTTWGRIKGLYR